MHKTGLSFLLAIIFFSTLAQAAPIIKPDPPRVSAKAYIIVDHDSGQVLAIRKAHERMEPASITKLMTAYVVFAELKAGNLKLTDKVRISKKAWRMPGSRSFVEVGKRIPVDTLLRGIIIQSGNDATVALAEHIAGSENTFVSLMNKYARQLGMKFTNFVNSTGLPHKDHYSTAHDITILSRAMIRDFPEYYKYYREKRFTYNGIKQYNRNRLLWRDKSVDGLKTGHTESAGYCLVSSAKRGDMRIVVVVLGDDGEEQRAVSSQALINYAFRFFETRKLFSAGQTLKKVRIWKGDKTELALGTARPVYISIPRGAYKKLKATVTITPQIMAPVGKQQKMGVLNISLDGDVLMEVPLVALEKIDKGGLWRRMSDSVRLWFQ